MKLTADWVEENPDKAFRFIRVLISDSPEPCAWWWCLCDREGSDCADRIFTRYLEVYENDFETR